MGKVVVGKVENGQSDLLSISRQILGVHQGNCLHKVPAQGEVLAPMYATILLAKLTQGNPDENFGNSILLDADGQCTTE